MDGRLSRQVLALICALVVAMIVTAVPAVGKNQWTAWRTSSSPLSITEGGGTAYGYGTWAVAATSNGDRYVARAKMRITNHQHNNGVYANHAPQSNSGRV